MRAAVRPPSLMNVLLEARSSGELALLLPQLPLLRLTAPRGSGTVMVLPGFLADDRWTWLLRRFLADLGYSALPWSLGVNRGPLASYVRSVAEQLLTRQSSGDDPVALVGWSRGGLIAREVAREYPELVRGVVTLGTPVRGGLEGTRIGAWVARESGIPVQQVSAWYEARARRPITVPVTAIYSRSDGVVAWPACRDDDTPGVRHEEVTSSHMGLVANATVYRRVAEALASLRSAAAA